MIIVMVAKNMLILFGSEKRDGFTAQLLGDFLNLLEVEVNKHFYYAYDNPVVACGGCGECAGGNPCKYNDMRDLHELICESDTVVVASPIHNLTFSAPLLQIFSRFQCYYLNRKSRDFRIFGVKRSGILLTTSGSDDKTGSDIAEKQLRYIFNTINTKLLAKVHRGSTDFSQNVNSTRDTEEQLAKAASSLSTALRDT